MNTPVKVNPEEGGQVTHRILTGVCLTIQGTLTTAVLSDISLTLKMIEI